METFVASVNYDQKISDIERRLHNALVKNLQEMQGGVIHAIIDFIGKSSSTTAPADDSVNDGPQDQQEEAAHRASNETDQRTDDVDDYPQNQQSAGPVRVPLLFTTQIPRQLEKVSSSVPSACEAVANTLLSQWKVQKTEKKFQSMAEPSLSHEEVAEVLVNVNSVQCVLPIGESDVEPAETQKRKKPRMLPSVYQDYQCDPKIIVPRTLLPQLEEIFSKTYDEITKEE
ncbi:hypothetical protein Bca4012_063250 [Brassica carinata]